MSCSRTLRHADSWEVGIKGIEPPTLRLVDDPLCPHALPTEHLPPLHTHASTYQGTNPTHSNTHHWPFKNFLAAKEKADSIQGNIERGEMRPGTNVSRANLLCTILSKVVMLGIAVTVLQCSLTSKCVIATLVHNAKCISFKIMALRHFLGLFFSIGLCPHYMTVKFLSAKTNKIYSITLLYSQWKMLYFKIVMIVIR